MPTTAILGGGLSGLSLAYYLARACPQDKIILLEKGSRLGGWIQTVKAGEDIHFESGPRSIRPVGLAGLLTLDLIDQLGLTPKLRTVSKSHPSAKNRYIYFNQKLHRAPNSLVSAVRASFDAQSPFHGFLGSVLTEPFKSKSDLVDESVHAFVSRRFGSAFAENVMSALVHGIYAGDTRQLSMGAVFPTLKEMERRRGSIVAAMLTGGAKISVADAEAKRALTTRLADVERQMRNVSVYSLQGGLQTLPDSLEAALVNQNNVELRQDSAVTRVSMQAGTKKVLLKCSGENLPVDRFMSAVSCKALHQILPSYTELGQTPFVTVGVVNLAFAAPYEMPLRGFGYLIPRSVPLEQNPHKALGVIFDSDMFDEKDPTRITVMLGGHYWSNGNAPQKEQLLQNALDTLRLHGIVSTNQKPVASHVNIHHDCIPQYAIGHPDRMFRIHRRLLLDFGGNVGAVGSSYTGVGVNDCIKASWTAARLLAKGASCTGLEAYAGEE